MKKLFFYFIVLLVSVWGGLKIAADPGYVLLDYQKTTVEMPLWLAVITIIFFFIVFYLVIRTIVNIRSLRARILAWSRARQVRRAWQRTHRGFIALLAGEVKLAENDLTRAAPSMDMPILNYLACAYAAQKQQAISRRDEYLGKVSPKTKLSELALGLTQAQLQIQEHQYEQALAKLQQLQHIAPKHKLILALLKKIYLKLNDWGSLEILLPSLEKYLLDKVQFEKLSKKTYRGLLKNSSSLNDAAPLWSRIPKALKSAPSVLTRYVVLLAKENPDEAERLLKAALDKNFSPLLLEYYGKLNCSCHEKQLQAVEAYLKNHSDNPVLFLTLARLCIKNQLWGKALHYFESSLSLLPQAKTYRELGELYEKLNDTAKAAEAYRKGLFLR